MCVSFRPQDPSGRGTPVPVPRSHLSLVQRTDAGQGLRQPSPLLLGRQGPRHLGAHPSFPGKGVNPVGVSVNIFSSSRCLAAPKSSKKGLFPITSRWLSFPL